MFELECLQYDIFRSKGNANRIAYLRGDLDGSASFWFGYGFVVTRRAGRYGEGCQFLGILDGVGPVGAYRAKLQQPCDVVGAIRSLVRAERRVSG